ncbi:uncharacterized protein N7477_007951 [Penicillium maclennaniae]|uniref:uncharacterized protein n=1 Tax=Penicillium maclennaniae TaxID=1343394 RepID=UPI0025423049|nr:uncharacterized protein N7477_007951 [Penicillium maclennaniae]KAJ5665503.1 hypothetical protein N7477_007951 [Penicillium maclennaniae]
MILSGTQILSRNLVQNLLNSSLQLQPYFTNANRKAAKTTLLQFTDTITLKPGSYLIDFNETVKVPRNCMASVLPRSSLWRSSVGISAGVVDAGYEGAMGR